MTFEALCVAALADSLGQVMYWGERGAWGGSFRVNYCLRKFRSFYIFVESESKYFTLPFRIHETKVCKNTKVNTCRVNSKRVGDTL